MWIPFKRCENLHSLGLEKVFSAYIIINKAQKTPRVSAKHSRFLNPQTLQKLFNLLMLLFGFLIGYGNEQVSYLVIDENKENKSKNVDKLYIRK